MTRQNDIEYLQSISRITSKNILKVIEERETFITNNRNKIDPDIEANLVSLANSKDMSNIELFFQLMSGMGFEPRDCLLGFIHFLDMPFEFDTESFLLSRDQILEIDLENTLGFHCDISYPYYGSLHFRCVGSGGGGFIVKKNLENFQKPNKILIRRLFNGRFKRKIIKELKKQKWKTKH